MRKSFVLMLMILSALTVQAQDSAKDGNASRFRPGAFWMYTGFRPANPERPEKYDRLMFDLTYNDWIGQRNLFTNHWASIGLNTSLMFDIPMSKRKNVASFGIGVSHEFTNIRHNANLFVNDSLGTTTYMPKDTSDIFRKSVLSGNSFSVPVEFRFRSPGWKHFKFHIGAKIGYQANLLSKYVSDIDGHKVVNKRLGFPDQSKLIYSAHIRIGARNWALFASYSFNRLFTNAQSTRLNRVQLGLTLSLF